MVLSLGTFRRGRYCKAILLETGVRVRMCVVRSFDRENFTQSNPSGAILGLAGHKRDTNKTGNLLWRLRGLSKHLVDI